MRLDHSAHGPHIGCTFFSLLKVPPVTQIVFEPSPAVEVELLVASVKELKDNSSSAEIRCGAEGCGVKWFDYRHPIVSSREVLTGYFVFLS